MDDIVIFIDSLNTHSYPSILKSYKKLIDYLAYSSIKLTLNDALKIFSKSNNIRIIIKSIKEECLDNTRSINENINNLFIAYDIIDKNDISNTTINNKEKNLLELYISQLPCFYSDDELNNEINKKMNGDKESIDRIVNHNLRLVVYLAKLYVRDGISIMDLIQEGNIGLIKATYKYNPLYNSKFTTFASLYIRGYILDYIYNNLRVIKIPKSSCVILDKINKFNNAFIDSPSFKEISKYTGISVNKIIELYNLPLECVSLDHLLDSKNYLETMSEDNIEEDIIRKTLLKESCELLFNNSKLKEKYKEIMLLRYGFIDGNQWQLDEIAKLYNLTKEGVRYIENKCLNIFSKDLEALKLYMLAENREEENIGIILKYGVSNKK